VLAHGVREPSGPGDTLHAAGEAGRAVEVSRWLDEGLVVRSTRRRACSRLFVVRAFAPCSPDSGGPRALSADLAR
jgi:hypothetical protein